MGNKGTGTFNQTGGSNYAYAIDLGGQATAITGTHNTSLQSSTFVTPGTYNLAGGLLQAASIFASNLDLYQQSPAYFNFTGGTLQAAPSVTLVSQVTSPGLNVGNMPITLTATSNAMLDMNGGTVSLTSLVVNAAAPGMVDFNFANPVTGNDLLSLNGLTVNSAVQLSFGTNPTTRASTS